MLSNLYCLLDFNASIESCAIMVCGLVGAIPIIHGMILCPFIPALCVILASFSLKYIVPIGKKFEFAVPRLAVYMDSVLVIPNFIFCGYCSLYGLLIWCDHSSHLPYFGFSLLEEVISFDSYFDVSSVKAWILLISWLVF